MPLLKLKFYKIKSFFVEMSLLVLWNNDNLEEKIDFNKKNGQKWKWAIIKDNNIENYINIFIIFYI